MQRCWVRFEDLLLSGFLITRGQWCDGQRSGTRLFYLPSCRNHVYRSRIGYELSVSAQDDAKWFEKDARDSDRILISPHRPYRSSYMRLASCTHGATRANQFLASQLPLSRLLFSLLQAVSWQAGGVFRAAYRLQLLVSQDPWAQVHVLGSLPSPVCLVGCSAL